MQPDMGTSGFTVLRSAGGREIRSAGGGKDVVESIACTDYVRTVNYVRTCYICPMGVWVLVEAGPVS